MNNISDDSADKARFFKRECWTIDIGYLPSPGSSYRLKAELAT